MLRERGATEAAMAAWALGEIEDSASVPALEQSVRATDARVRLAAVDALGNIEDKRALNELERALRSDTEASARAGSKCDWQHRRSVVSKRLGRRC